MPGTVLSDLHAPLSPISMSLLKAEGFLQLEAEEEVGEVQSPRRTGPAVAGLKLSGVGGACDKEGGCSPATESGSQLTKAMGTSAPQRQRN